jgi:DNA-binding beta-propeller fold protein YncE
VCRLRSIALLAGLLAALGSGRAPAAGLPGQIGPSLGLLGDGRHLTPQGRLTTLGNFPTGGALTPDGRFYWTVSTGRGVQDIRIVSVASGRVIQTLPLAGASGGIAMDPAHRRAYVSGVQEPDRVDGADYRIPNAPGREGDVVLTFTYSSSGIAHFAGLIPVPPPSGAPVPQHFPPTKMGKFAWPDRLAISHNGLTLLVPLNLADAAAIVDVPTKRVRYVSTGHYPYGAAILRDGRTGLVSNETSDTAATVSVIDLVGGTKVKDIVVSSHLSHPEAIAIDPFADRAYVAVANTDQVAVIDTKSLVLDRTLSVARDEGNGTSPVALTATPDGAHLLVALAGSNEIAVFGLPHAPRGRSPAQLRAQRILDHELRAAVARASSAPLEPEDGGRRTGVAAVAAAFPLIGRIPVAAYPTDVQAVPSNVIACTPVAGRKRRRAHRKRKRRLVAAVARSRIRASPRTCPKLLWIAGKGLGVGPVSHGPNAYFFNSDYNDSGSPLPSNSRSFQYLPDIIFGKAGILDFPSDKRIAALTRDADRQLRPTNAEHPPPDTPLRPGGPIQHVFYIVKENRTYDQVLGDDSRGDGAPGYTLFGRQITPNLHALVERFPLLDHLYANSEASIDGHFWTSAAKVSDYVHKNWFQNYRSNISAGGDRPYDFGAYSVTYPENGFLFDQAERQGISWFNFGEALAGVSPLPDKDRDNAGTQAAAAKLAKSDVGVNAGCFPADFNVGSNAITDAAGAPQDTTVETFDSSPPAGAAVSAESRFDCFRLRFNAQLATNSVPAFTEIILNSDHTRGAQPGQRTPRAMVAENDYGLGQVVDLISHSSVWPGSAIFVVEDDSQDGSDHVDAHRMTAAVISPFAKRGAVIHTRYDQLSVIRSFELILGMKPLGLFDQLATPMYDAFQSTPDNEPYSVIQPIYPLLERNPSANTAAARASARMDFRGLDRISQRELDRVVWKTVYGDAAEPPPPGPNAVAGG